MATHLSLGVLLGIIIGAIAVSLTVAITVIIIVQRVKHRRLLAQTNAAGERRLSRYPGGNVSITDEDVARIPGTGNALRSSLHTSRSRQPTYMPMSSREDVEKAVLPGGVKEKSPKMKEPSSQNRPVEQPGRFRGLRRTNGHPMMELHSTPLSPVDESRIGPSISVKKGRRLGGSKDIVVSATPGDSGGNQDVEILRLKIQSQSSPGLQPKPLFHEKRRSISHGMLLDYKEAQEQERRNRTERQGAPIKGMTRSVSLCSQEATSPPSQPVPILPQEAEALRRQKNLAATWSSLRYSKSGPNLGEALGRGERPESIQEHSLGPSHLRASATSLTLAQPKIVHCYSRDLSARSSPEHTSQEGVAQTQASPTPMARTRTVRSPSDHHRSLRASIRDSAQQSDGDRVSKSPVQSTMSRKQNRGIHIREDSTIREVEPSSSDFEEPYASVFDVSEPRSSKFDMTSTTLDEQTRSSKRLSASALQELSDNEQNALKFRRPSSSPTKQEHCHSTEELTDHEVTQDAKYSHHDGKTNSMHSDRPSIALVKLSIAGEKDRLHQPRASAMQTLRKPRTDPLSFRPPSRTTFDPDISTSPRHRLSPPSKENSHSKTLAKLNGNEDNDSSPSSVLSTPTRKPPKHRPSASHPNRQRPIFDSSSLGQWPLANSHPELSLGLLGKRIQEKPDATQANPQAESGLSPKRDDRPPSLLYRFPSPPPAGKELNPDPIHKTFGSRQPRQPSIRGPRTPPRPSLTGRMRRSPNTTNSFLLASPTRHGHPRSSIDEAASDLRKSVIALRRMNSEITDYSGTPHRHDARDNSGHHQHQREQTGTKEHRRYVSLSDRESRLFFETADRDVEERMRAIASVEGEARFARSRRRRRPSVSTSASASASVQDANGGGGAGGDDSGAETDTQSASTSTSRFSDRYRAGTKRIRGPRAMPDILDEDMLEQGDDGQADGRGRDRGGKENESVPV